MTESNSQETSGMITTQLLQLFYTAGQRCKLGLTVCDTIKIKKQKDPYQGKTSFINFKNIYKNKNNNQQKCTPRIHVIFETWRDCVEIMVYGAHVFWSCSCIQTDILERSGNNRLKNSGFQNQYNILPHQLRNIPDWLRW